MSSAGSALPAFSLKEARAYPHHPMMDTLTELLCFKTGMVNRHFFQAEIAYFLSIVPSMLHVKVYSPERGLIPVNCYSICLANSGFGKGISIETTENVLEKFRKRFMEEVFFERAEENLYTMAQSIAIAKGTSEDTELSYLKEEFNRQGHFPFSFDSGSGPALKQLRYKLQLAGAGSVNFQMDEIGSNLLNNQDILTVMLELFDLGKVKIKLIKNTADQKRGIDIRTSTPANMLMFGTSAKLFDGARIENEFYSFLTTGYARRCLFGVGVYSPVVQEVSPKKHYEYLTRKSKQTRADTIGTTLEALADKSLIGKTIGVPDETGIDLLAYRMLCEQKAAGIPEHEEIRKAELSHRYFKALKLAGCYAFLDSSDLVTRENLYQAIRLVEESGASFDKILTRKRNFIRLAEYLAESDQEMTHADLVEDLPYYPTSVTARKEMMDLSMAWGVSNNVMITKTTTQGIDFFRGENLRETDTDRLRLSWSEHPVEGFRDEIQPLERLPRMMTPTGVHWSNHQFKDGVRTEATTIRGFSFVTVETDLEEDLPFGEILRLLSGWKHVASVSKNPNTGREQLRVLLPCSHELRLSRENYALFVKSLLYWLPFRANASASQRTRRWINLPGTEISVNDDESLALLDVLPLIPKTKGNVDFLKRVDLAGNLGNLDRWYLSLVERGIKAEVLRDYARTLGASGLPKPKIIERMAHLNACCEVPLKKGELLELHPSPEEKKDKIA